MLARKRGVGGSLESGGSGAHFEASSRQLSITNMTGSAAEVVLLPSAVPVFHFRFTVRVCSDEESLAA